MVYVNSLDCYVNRLEDFEGLMNYDAYKALETVVSSQIGELEDKLEGKPAGDDFELIADGYYQQLSDADIQLNKIIDYLTDSKRMNKATLLSMLLNLKNTIENY